MTDTIEVVEEVTSVVEVVDVGPQGPASGPESDPVAVPMIEQEAIDRAAADESLQSQLDGISVTETDPVATAALATHAASTTAHGIGTAAALASDTDNTLAADSDSRLATQKATKGYITTQTGLLVPKSLIDAKGDLLVGTADNTVARKAVGSNGKVLVADSGQSDGLKWGGPSDIGAASQTQETFLDASPVATMHRREMSANVNPTSSQALHGFRCMAKASGNFTNLRCIGLTIGTITGLKFGVWTAAGTLLAETANQTSFDGTTVCTISLGATVAVTEGTEYLLGFGCIFSAAPTFRGYNPNGATYGYVSGMSPALAYRHASAWTSSSNSLGNIGVGGAADTYVHGFPYLDLAP